MKTRQWQISKHGNNDSFGIYAEGSPNDLAIVVGGNEEGGIAEANAELIVKAVNNHEALVSALKACLACLKMDSDMEEDFAVEIKQAGEAIKNAEL